MPSLTFAQILRCPSFFLVEVVQAKLLAASIAYGTGLKVTGNVQKLLAPTFHDFCPLH